MEPPLLTREAAEPLDIVKYHVIRSEYARCVAADACLRSEGDRDELPQTSVSWYDATAYARWLSKATGQTWRLPTDEEWQRAAAERFVDAAAGVAGDPGDRLLASYARNAEGRSAAGSSVRPSGGFGENSLGVADLAGNVWSGPRPAASAHGRDRRRGDRGHRILRCPHRVGPAPRNRHRLRPRRRAGGCGAGVPPDYLGFPLVRGA